MLEAYKIGVHIAMSTNSGQVLAVLSRDLLGLGKHTKALTGQLNMMKVAAIGAMGAVAGGAVLASMAKLVDHGRAFVHQQELMRQAAISNMEIGQATAKAWEMAANIRGTTSEKNMELIADLRNVMGSMSDALKVADSMAQVQAVLGNVTGKDPGQAGFKFAKFLEQRGALTDPVTHKISAERLEQQAKLGMAIVVGTRGRVGPDELLNFQAQARAAGMLLTDKGLLNAVPFIQATGGHRAGTMLAAIQQQLLAGVMTQRSSGWLTEMGLLPKDAVKKGESGFAKVDTKRLKGADVLPGDVSGWVEQYLIPALVAKGHVTAEQQTLAVMRSGFRQTTIGGLTEFARNAPVFSKESENIQRVYDGPNPYSVMFGGKDGKGPVDPTAAMVAFTAAWGNLLTALGVPLVETATNMLLKLGDGVNAVAAFAAAHPDLVGTLELTAAGLAGLAVAMGAFAVGTAAAGAIGLLTGPTGLLALAIGIEAFGRGLSSFPKWVVDAAAGAAAGAGVGLRLGGGPGAYLGALLGGGAGLATGGAGAAASVLPNLNDRLNNANRDSYFNRFNKQPAPDPHPVTPGDLMNRMNYSPGGGGGPAVIRGDVYFDGAKVGQWIARNLAGQMGRPAAGPSAVDTRMTLVQPGGAFA